LPTERADKRRKRPDFHHGIRVRFFLKGISGTLFCMLTSLFDYHLPKSRIAQKSVHPRDASRLMVLDRPTETIKETRFRQIGDFLRSGDLLVVNDTKVFRARLLGKLATGGQVELFLLHARSSTAKTSQWEALAKPGKKLLIGTEIFGNGWSARVIQKGERGMVVLAFARTAKSVFALLAKEGHIPVPPYVLREPKKEADYQTVFARAVGSVAAPTAGFHFTKPLIASLKKKGVRFAPVTLHVGIGTFQPVVVDDLSEHTMHAEYAEIPGATLRAIRQTKKAGGRVIVVGTTALRALEGLYAEERFASRKSVHDWVSIFITPGYCFKVADGLITNFHLPRSTLLVLVSAFANRNFILRAYRRAVRKKFRFFSFGDAMLIL
jgi:S-adenosylmethionine:tRNA ribosyltransferase-isomerase